MTIRFTANVTPRGKQRARTVHLANGKTTSFTPKETVQFERAIAWACKAAYKGEGFAEHMPLKMTVMFYMPIPESLSEKKKAALNGEWHTKKPDCSNILKSIEDALNAVAYKDDGQIAAGEFSKIYSDCPRVEVIIEQLDSRKGGTA